MRIDLTPEEFNTLHFLIGATNTNHLDRALMRHNMNGAGADGQMRLFLKMADRARQDDLPIIPRLVGAFQWESYGPLDRIEDGK